MRADRPANPVVMAYVDGLVRLPAWRPFLLNYSTMNLFQAGVRMM